MNKLFRVITSVAMLVAFQQSAFANIIGHATQSDAAE